MFLLLCCACCCTVLMLLLSLPQHDACCWSCRSCGEFQVRQNEWTCEDCPAGYRPTADHQACMQVPEEVIGYGHPWAIAAMAVASFG